MVAVKKDLRIGMLSKTDAYIFLKRISEVGSPVLVFLETQLLCHVALLCVASIQRWLPKGPG